MRIHTEFSTTTIWTEGKKHPISPEMDENAGCSAQKQTLRILSVIVFDSVSSLLVEDTENWTES